MKHLFKNLLAVWILSAAVSASAALGVSTPQILLTGRAVPGGATSNYTAFASATLACGAAENVALDVRFTSMGTNANNFTLVVQKSLDGSVWDANQILSWVIVGNGTNTVTQATNIAVLGYGALRVFTIANQNPDIPVTNIIVRGSPKTLR